MHPPPPWEALTAAKIAAFVKDLELSRRWARKTLFKSSTL